MKTYSRGYLMASASVVLLLVALFVPSNGHGDDVWPLFAASTILALSIALVSQFGKGKIRDWIEANF